MFLAVKTYLRGKQYILSWVNLRDGVESVNFWGAGTGDSTVDDWSWVGDVGVGADGNFRISSHNLSLLGSDEWVNFNHYAVFIHEAIVERFH